MLDCQVIAELEDQVEALQLEQFETQLKCSNAEVMHKEQLDHKGCALDQLSETHHLLQQSASSAVEVIITQPDP